MLPINFSCLEVVVWDEGAEVAIQPLNHNTHPSHSLEVVGVLMEINGLTVEGPGEGHVQGWISSHLAGQHDALTHRDLCAAGALAHPRGLC